MANHYNYMCECCVTADRLRAEVERLQVRENTLREQLENAERVNRAWVRERAELRRQWMADREQLRQRIEVIRARLQGMGVIR